jgi:hypothetical protein
MGFTAPTETKSNFIFNPNYEIKSLRDAYNKGSNLPSKIAHFVYQIFENIAKLIYNYVVTFKNTVYTLFHPQTFSPNSKPSDLHKTKPDSPQKNNNHLRPLDKEPDSLSPLPPPKTSPINSPNSSNQNLDSLSPLPSPKTSPISRSIIFDQNLDSLSPLSPPKTSPISRSIIFDQNLDSLSPLPSPKTSPISRSNSFDQNLDSLSPLPPPKTSPISSPKNSARSIACQVEVVAETQFKNIQGEAAQPIDEQTNSTASFISPKYSSVNNRSNLLGKSEENLSENSGNNLTEHPNKTKASPLLESNEASYVQWTSDVYKQWFVDSGRPEKGQKYVLSLNRSIDTLKSSGYDLEQLAERIQGGSSSSNQGWQGYYFSGTLEYLWPCNQQSFAHFAYTALKALVSPDQYIDRYQNTNVRLQYADFLQNLRKALTSQDYLEHREKLDPNLIRLLETLCHDKFTNTCLFNYWEAFLLQLCGKVPKDLNFTAFSHLLTEHNEKLENSPPELRKESFILNYEKLQGTIGASFDPVGRSNVPKKRSEQTIDSLDGHWTMTRIAHGTPTLEENALTKACRYTFGYYNAEIIPEYKAFLRAAKARGERVFYVNLQKTKAWQSERDRSLVIEQLQEDPEFQETFYSMALPMDGTEFSNLIKKEVSTEEFKKNLLKLFFDEKNQLTQQTAKLPRDLLQRIEKNPELAGKIASHMCHLIDQAHALYFDGEELATNKDRQDFIMQFYSDLTDYMISMEYKRQDTGQPLQDHERIRYVVQACKDNKDRGGAKNGIDEAKYILLTYPLNDPQALHQALYDLYINTLGAYTIKFEEILPDRLIYFTSLMEKYGRLAQDPAKIQRIRDAQPGYFRVREHKSARAFDKAPSTSVPTIQTALTRTDYIKTLQSSPEISIEFNGKLNLHTPDALSNLSDTILNLARAHFGPRYADINFALPKTDPKYASILKTDPMGTNLIALQDLDLIDSQGITHAQTQIILKKEKTKTTIALKLK